jgi:predicted metal-dependent peptidase
MGKSNDRFPELVETMSTISWTHSFWATLLYDMLKIRVTEEFPTLAVGGGFLYINREYFVDKLTAMNRLAALAHEIGHEMFMHPEKMQGYQTNGFDGEAFDAFRYNVAGDYVINSMLQIMKVGQIHEDWLLSPHFNYLDGVDDVYRRLKPKDPPPEDGGEGGEGQGDGQSGDGPGEPAPQQYDILDKDGNVVGETDKFAKPQDTHLSGKISPHTELDWKTAIAAAHEGAKAIGQGNAEMDKFVDGYIDTKRPWNAILRDHIVIHRGRDRRNYSRLHKRRMHQFGLVTPTKNSHKIGDVLLIDDVSGSVSNHEQKLFKSAIVEILLDCRPKSIRVMCVASNVIHDETFKTITDFEGWEPRGTGGTDMEAGMREIEGEDYDPHVCIVLTDGYTNTSEAPPYPVVWVSTGAQPDEFAYGRVVMMDDV